MLLVVQGDAVPYFEELCDPVEVLVMLAGGPNSVTLTTTYLLLEPVQLNHSVSAGEKLDLVPTSRSTPLRRYDLLVVQGKGIAATGRFPSPAGLGESSDAVLV